MHDFVEASWKQHNFIVCLWSNVKFRTYYDERTDKDKGKVDGVLERCRDLDRWNWMKVLNEALTIHFKVVHGLCSRSDFPLSAYVLLIQALRNDIVKGINFERGQFDVVLGDGARAEIAGVIEERFNMDGRAPSGCKVGLLDRHHLMAYLVDPFAHEWRNKFKLQTGKASLVDEMMELFVPLDEDGTSRTRTRVREEFEVRHILLVLEIDNKTALSFETLLGF